MKAFYLIPAAWQPQLLRREVAEPVRGGAWGWPGGPDVHTKYGCAQLEGDCTLCRLEVEWTPEANNDATRVQFEAHPDVIVLGEPWEWHTRQAHPRLVTAFAPKHGPVDPDRHPCETDTVAHVVRKLRVTHPTYFRPDT
jgi:hypothetical protein